jgi:hypothetical protein
MHANVKSALLRSRIGFLKASVIVRASASSRVIEPCRLFKRQQSPSRSRLVLAPHSFSRTILAANKDSANQ